MIHPKGRLLLDFHRLRHGQNQQSDCTRRKVGPLLSSHEIMNNILHAISNAARAVTGRPSPHHSIVPPTRPAAVSTVSAMQSTGRRVTSDDVQSLASYSQQHKLFPMAGFEPDAFTKTYCTEPYLPSAGPGKSYFVVSSPRLLSLIFFAHTGRMGFGWMQPWFNALVLGVDLPSQPDLFGCGFTFWQPIANPLRDKAALKSAEEEVRFRAELDAQRAVDKRSARRNERLTADEISAIRNSPEMLKADEIARAACEESKQYSANHPPGVQEVRIVNNPTP